MVRRWISQRSQGNAIDHNDGISLCEGYRCSYIRRVGHRERVYATNLSLLLLLATLRSATPSPLDFLSPRSAVIARARELIASETRYRTRFPRETRRLSPVGTELVTGPDACS